MNPTATAALKSAEEALVATLYPAGDWPAAIKSMQREALKLVREALQQAPTYTEGHCAEKRKPGGCQLHNLHCGYPACDRKPADDMDRPTTEAEQTAMRRLHAPRKR